MPLRSKLSSTKPAPTDHSSIPVLKPVRCVPIRYWVLNRSVDTETSGPIQNRSNKRQPAAARALYTE